MAKKTAPSSVDFSAAIASSMTHLANPNLAPPAPPPPAPPPVPRSQQVLSGANATAVLKELNVTPEQLAGAIAQVTASVSVPVPSATVPVPIPVQQAAAVDLRGVAKFSSHRAPESFQQLAESPDGSIALLLETRNWEINKKTGTSHKLVVRTKYIDKKTGEKMYGYDYGSIPNELEIFLKVVDLLSGFAAGLRK